MSVTIAKFIVLLNLLSLLSRQICWTQQTNIVLEQGALVGLKVFPDSSRSAVYAFLGVPYAQPPLGELRFAPPKPHTGWNWTLQAMNMKPICPQLTNSIYDETPEGNLARPALMDEDCLYLNIWVPEAGMRFGNLPVLVIITGERMAFDWPRNRPIGLDFASEGVVVITVQYRSNIFGWISLGNNELPGNYGLQDQQLALQWIQYNIQHFGGNPRQLTLLGHGTSGVPCVLAHLLSIAIPAQALFSKAILMSGGDALSILQSNETVVAASRLMVQKLGCQFEGPVGGQVATCLRSKSLSDLQMAFESIYDHGNGSMQLGPVLKRDPILVLTNATWLQRRPPLIIGICSNEGAFLEDYWLDLVREGPSALGDYVNYTVLPQVLRKFGQYNGGISQQLVNALRWKYFEDGEIVSMSKMLYAMQRLISEFNYEMPFFETLERLTATNLSDVSSIYAYVLEVSNSMDLRGKINLFDGASHASDLPLLLGPSLYQQIARRRFTAEEDKLCRKLRAAFANFIKSGNPTPGRVFDSWLAYTKTQRFIYALGESLAESNEVTHGASVMKNQQQIEKLFEQDKSNGIGLSRPNRNELRNPYQLAAQSPVASDDARRTKSVNYYNKNQLDSGYALHLKHIHGFWQLMLPNVATYGADGTITDALSQRMRLMEASADAQRYKQGFFAMLSLVCVLLAILGLCVYLLRRDPLRIPSHGATNFRL